MTPSCDWLQVRSQIIEELSFLLFQKYSYHCCVEPESHRWATTADDMWWEEGKLDRRAQSENIRITNVLICTRQIINIPQRRNRKGGGKKWYFNTFEIGASCNFTRTKTYNGKKTISKILTLRSPKFMREKYFNNNFAWQLITSHQTNFYHLTWTETFLARNWSPLYTCSERIFGPIKKKNKRILQEALNSHL